MKKNIFSLVLIFVIGLCQTGFATPLDDYVKKEDSHYSWKIEKTIEQEDVQVFIIDLQSQKWRNETEVNEPYWHHPLVVVRPKQLLHSQALLYINNGRTTDPFPEQAESRWIEIARNTHSIVASLYNVPHQPLMYFNDGKLRQEDDSVAFSWNQVMKTHDPNWNIRFPMVKAVFKAMDTIDHLMLSEKGGKVHVQGYVIAGASKRGWATWLTAAVDQAMPKPRVKAIVPMVIDVLNVQESMKHHYAVYGFWAPAIKDYQNQGIVQKFQSPEFKEMMEYEDPFSYRSRIQIPKYMINASGDQFFLPDSSQFYFDQLLGPKYLRYLPNSGHSMGGSDAFRCLESFYSSVIHSSSLPRFKWKFNSDRTLQIETQDQPTHVTLWSSTNPSARDFRISPQQIYSSTPLQEQGKGIYSVKLLTPEKGYSAYFAELEFKNPNSLIPFKFTTEINVIGASK